ncbi:MAG: benzoate transporter, partial [Burkholderiales bacterium]|nr:benzoate transporter [Burkholderiales bacterium]
MSAIVITLLIAVLNAGWWALNNRPSAHPDWTGKVNGLAYSGFQRDQDPTKKRFPTQDELARDMALMAQVTHRIRTYTSTENATVPRLAREAGLKVTAGAWLDTREEHNQAEIQALVQAVRENPNVDRVIVGNESILRGDVAVRDMIRYLKQVRGKVNVPVSTAEPWHIWMRYPELARNVDYITIHLLPYW